ncbi:MAG TPA: DEAD/DEAH box helicase, partial [Kofleriaceae bacterium]
MGLATTKRPRTTTTKKKAEPAKPPPKAAASAAKPRPKRAPASTPAEVVAAKPLWDLRGAVPPEGAGFPPKVGALLGVGQKALGIKTFRTGQAEAFEHLLGGHDVLAVMPTGSGKSLLYQLTSL